MLLCLVMYKADAQADPITTARAYTDAGQYDKAIEAYKSLYKQNPIDDEVYREYLNVLLVVKDYKQAERIVVEQKSIRINNPMVYIDMGRIHLANGKDKKANEEFDIALQFINGDDILTQQVATGYTTAGKDEYAIRAYEKARELLRAPYMYTGPLSRLYAAKGDVDKAIFTMLEGVNGFMRNNTEDTKAGLLELLGNDPKKLQQAQKALVKRINEQPENPYYADLLTWLYTQKDDWEGALIQVVALDIRNKENGERIQDFARLATKEEEYAIAIKAYDEIMQLGKELPLYTVSKAEKLRVQFLQLQINPAYKKEEVAALVKSYETLFAESPHYYTMDAARDYAKLEALYNNNPAKGIEILETALKQPGISKLFTGEVKLQLGDYQVVLGKVWDASLLYSQVDKAFREDYMGEEARFRNAKLAYYRGDFEWAQGQLTVLKASTSELIANDALYLSILITENITPDSNYVPIRRFAYADLLLFQNKDQEAEALLDSIMTTYPEHPLKDDILMQKAKLAEKHRVYEKAITYYADIVKNHGKDVLGDDAIFSIANVYEKYLNKPDEAKKYYETLIIDYPGSTYIQTARNRLAAMQGGSIPMP